MEHSTAQRRLVKSPPELWAEVSSKDTLGRHLAPFGEIRITRVEPETTVAWEGERASGTVELAPAGWGTKVILTATPAEQTATPEAPPAEPVEPSRPLLTAPPRAPEPHPEAAAPPAPDQPRHAGFLARLRRRRSPDAAPPAPAPPQPRPPALGPAPPPPAPDPAPTPAPAPGLDTPNTQAILDEALDRLGGTHHPRASSD